MHGSLSIVAPVCMCRVLVSCLGLVASLLVNAAWAAAQEAELRYPRNPDPALARIKTVFLQVTIQRSARDGADPSVDGRQARLLGIVSRRMRALGYTLVTEQGNTHDVMVRFACEETEPWKRRPVERLVLRKPRIARDRPAVVPPCVLSYEFEGRAMPWQRVDRIVYADGVEAARHVADRSSGGGRDVSMEAYLEEYDFPVLLTAEWGQPARLIDLYHDAGTTRARKARIMRVLGEIRAEEGFSLLVAALADEELAATAARALGFYGAPARPILLELLTTTHQPRIQAAAANGLGRIGAMTGDATATPILLEVLTRPETDIRVQTEIVWALGKAPDFSAHAVLAELERTIWMVYSHDPRLQRLREAVDWSIREVRQGGHTDEY